MEEDFIELNEEISWKPLERIALSMSGGGYLAALVILTINSIAIARF